MEKKSVHSFSGKMDLNSSLETVRPNDYGIARNFDANNSKESNVGGGGNIKGNRILPYTQPSGINIVIGSATYTKENAIIKFVYNSNSNHYISIIDNGVESLLIQASWLNFTDKLMNNPKCYDDYVVFTDANNDVRMFNIVYLRNYRSMIYKAFGSYSPNNIIYTFDELQNSVITTTKALTYQDKLYVLDGVSATYPLKPPPQTYFQVVGDYLKESYREVTEETIKLIAAPPKTGVTSNALYDNTKAFNNIYDNNYIFAYSYEYLDGRRSVFSPISPIDLKMGSLSEDGYLNSDAPNTLQLSLYTGNRDVSKLHIIFKTSKNPTAIYNLATINKYSMDSSVLVKSNINYNNIYFSNSKLYTTFSYKDYIRLYDFIPRTAGIMDILNDGRVLLGDIDNEAVSSEFKPIIDLEVIKETSDDSITTAGTYSVTSYSNTTDSETVDYDIYSITLPKGYQTGMMFYMAFTVTDAVGTVLKNINVLVRPSAFWNDKTNDQKLLWVIRLFTNEIRRNILLIHEIEELDRDGYSTGRVVPQFAINSKFNIDTTNVEGEARLSRNDDNPIFAISTEDFYDPIITPNVDDFVIATHIRTKQNGVTLEYNINVTNFIMRYQNITSYESLKSNSTWDIGVQYYDTPLRSTGYKKVGEISTDSLASFGVIHPTNREFTRNILKATINSLAPKGAKYYSFIASKNRLYSKYIQIMVKDVSSPSTYTNFNINNVITDMTGSNINFNKSPWILQKGDRVRFIAAYDSTTQDYTYQDRFDKQILLQDDTTGLVSIEKVTLSNYDIVELYRFSKATADDNNDIYFEIGDIRKIVEVGGKLYHEGNMQNQTSTQPAISKVNWYNCILRQRLTIDGTDAYKYIIEDESVSDYISSKIEVYTRPTISSENLHYGNRNILRFGGRLLPATDKNYIARFEYDDYDELSNMFGRITGIRNIGYTIKVYQEHKVTSYYSGKNMLKEAANGSQIVLIDKVLSNKTISDFDFGCTHPESVTIKDTHIFFYDGNNGCFVRDSKNGLFNISRYGVSEFSNSLKHKDVTISGIYDKRAKLVMFTILSADESYYETIGFNDEKDGFTSFFDFYDKINGRTVNLLGATNTNMVAYVKGYSYLFDSDVYNKLFGSDVETSVQVISNEEPTLIKIWNYITVNSNFNVNSKNDGDVSVDYGKQISKIRMYKGVEGRYVSEFKRNLLYPNGTLRPNENAGEVLRGKTASVILRVTTNEKFRISTVIISGTLSEKII